MTLKPKFSYQNVLLKQKADFRISRKSCKIFHILPLLMLIESSHKVN